MSIKSLKNSILSILQHTTESKNKEETPAETTGLSGKNICKSDSKKSLATQIPSVIKDSSKKRTLKYRLVKLFKRTGKKVSDDRVIIGNMPQIYTQKISSLPDNVTNTNHEQDTSDQILASQDNVLKNERPFKPAKYVSNKSKFITNLDQKEQQYLNDTKPVKKRPLPPIPSGENLAHKRDLTVKHSRNDRNIYANIDNTQEKYDDENVYTTIGDLQEKSTDKNVYTTIGDLQEKSTDKNIDDTLPKSRDKKYASESVYVTMDNLRKKSADENVYDTLPKSRGKKSADVNVYDTLPKSRGKKSADVNVYDTLPKSRGKKSADVNVYDTLPKSRGKKSADEPIYANIGNTQEKPETESVYDTLPKSRGKKSADEPVYANIGNTQEKPETESVYDTLPKSRGKKI